MISWTVNYEPLERPGMNKLLIFNFISFLCDNNNDDNIKSVFFYNFKRFLACMIFLTTRSVMVFFPGKRSMALIILESACHLSCRLLA